MPLKKQSINKHSFATGVISPALYGRVDIDKYDNALAECKNANVNYFGGVENRAGTEYKGDIRENKTLAFMTPRMVPFQASTGELYILVFFRGAFGYGFRVFKDGGVIVPFVSLPSLSTYLFLTEFKYAQSADVLYLAHVSERPIKITRVSEASWTCENIDFDAHPYHKRVRDDYRIMCKPNSYSGSMTVKMLGGLPSHYSGDGSFPSELLGISHLALGYPNPIDPSVLEWVPCLITNYSSGMHAFTVAPQYPYLGYEMLSNWDFTDGVSFWSSGALINYTLTSEVVGGQAVAQVKNVDAGANKVGMYQETIVSHGEEYLLRVQMKALPSTTGSVVIYAGTSTTTADVLAKQTITDTSLHTYPLKTSASPIYIIIDTNTTILNLDYFQVQTCSLRLKDLATSNWRLPAKWDNDNGYPSDVALYQQRLVFASTTNEPDTLWLSKLGDYENFGFNSPSLETDSIAVTLSENRFDKVKWLAVLKDLYIGMPASEWGLSGVGGAAISPTSVEAKKIGGYGAGDVSEPLIVDSTLVVRTFTGKIRNLTYSLEADGLVGGDLTLLVSHLFENRGVKDWAYDAKERRIYCVMDDTSMLVLTYLKEQNIWAWSEYETDSLGALSPGHGYVSVATGQHEGEHEVWLLCWRNIGGKKVLALEKIRNRITPDDTYPYRYFHVDCGVEKLTSGAGTDTVATSHLTSEDVTVLADGSVYNVTTNSDGGFTIPISANTIIFGLPYTTDIKTVPLESQDGGGGSSVGKIKSVIDFDIRFHNSGEGVEAGLDFSELVPVPLRSGQYTGAPVPLVSELVTVGVRPNNLKTTQICIRQENPLPLAVLAIVPQINVRRRK